MGLIDGFIKGGVAALGDTADKIIKDFKLDPTVSAQLSEKIQEAQMQHQEAMAKQAEEILQSQLADVASARDMEIKLNEAQGASWLAKNINSLLALSVSLLWGAVTVYLLLRIMNLIEASSKVDMTSLMAFYTAITATETIIISFYFGSSSSSQKKDETISKIAQQP